MVDAVSKSFTLEDMREFSKEFMVRMYGRQPKAMPDDQRDRFYTEFGLLTHFIGELWDKPFKPEGDDRG